MRNTFYLWKKHATVVIFLKIIWWRFIHTRSHISNLKGHPEQIEACLLGVWDALRNLGGEYNANRKAPWLIRFLLIKN
jgi:hypothetical protein